MNYDFIIIGAGLTGCVIARELAETGKNILVLERRIHIGGNMYDFINEDGILVHKYGPHCFHTKNKTLIEYICKYSEWKDFYIKCGAEIDGKYTPTPFNFQTIDDFYSKEEAEKIKNAIKEEYPNQEFATVLELLNHKNKEIKKFATFLFEKDYSLYTAKQWGISPSEIDPSVLKRVPIRFSYNEGYFDDEYQKLPVKSYLSFFESLVNHPNIEIVCNTDMKERLSFNFDEKKIFYQNILFDGKLIYTGPIDELMNYKYGKLPYRSLRFEWKTEMINSFQKYPLVAYPQAIGYTRITEYTKLPEQKVGNKTTYAIEYPLLYNAEEKNEPYYPVLTEDSKKLLELYKNEISKYSNIICCGRLGDFQYYNMDQALERAIHIAKQICNQI